MDSPSSMSMAHSALSITDCRYNKPDNHAIDCIITVNGKSFLFTATQSSSQSCYLCKRHRRGIWTDRGIRVNNPARCGWDVSQ